jgi:hypothetical protein
MKAGRAIHMKPPYFHVKAGATFSARIECNSSNKMALPNAYDDLESEVVTLKSKNPIFSNELLNNNQSNLVTVYPNPTKEKFNIKINGYYDTIVTLKLSDLLGQTIFTTTGKQNSFSFNLSKYPKGIYLLKTTIGAKIDLQKVVYQ